MIEILTDLPDHVLAMSATGTVTAEDYETVLLPALEARLKKHKKIRLLGYLGHEFEGYTAGAMWDDAKLGLRHLTAFERVAVVTDAGWVIKGIKAFAFMLPGKVKTYSNQQLAEATAWVSE